MDVVVPPSVEASVAVAAGGPPATSVEVANVVVMFGTGDVVAVSVGLGTGVSVTGKDVSVTGTGVSVGGSVAVSVGTAWMSGCVGATAVGIKFEGRHAPMISSTATAKTNLFISSSFG